MRSGKGSGLFLEFETREFGLEGRVPDRGFQVDVFRDEQGERAGSVRGPGRFFHERFVEFGVFLFLGRTELFGSQFFDLRVQFIVVGLREILVVGRLDVAPVEQEEEIVRVRIVLEPVGEPGVQVRGRRVPDHGEVVVGVEDFEFRFEADFVQDARVVGARVVVRALRVGPDRDFFVFHARFGDEFLRLRDVVREQFEFFVTGHPGRQDLLRAFDLAGVDAFQRRRVDRVVDRFTDFQVVERFLRLVHPEVVRGDRRLEPELGAFEFFLYFLVTVGRGRIEDPVELARFDVVDLGRLVAVDFDFDLVDVAGRDFDLFPVVFRPVGVPFVIPTAARLRFGDHVRARGRRRARRLVFLRRVLRDRGDEHERELVVERAARFDQVDDDFAGLFVRLDAGDAALLGFRELFRADDVGVEGRTAGVGDEAAFDGEFEVGRFDRFAVRVFEAFAQVHRVGLAAVGDFRQFFGQARNDFRAFFFGSRFVGQQGNVDGAHRRPTLGRVRDLRVHVVRERGVGPFQGAAFVAFAFGGSAPAAGFFFGGGGGGAGATAAPPAAGGKHDRHDRRKHSDRQDYGQLPQD